MPLNLNPQQLKNYICSHEMAVRAGSFSTPLVETVFRYGGFVGADIRSFVSLERAMDYCRCHIDQLEKESRSVVSGTVVLADTLNRSKGRFGREWHAPEGGLWGCMILVNTFLNETARLLPLTLGVSCCEALREAGADRSVIRWVNDVLIDQKKIGGFLIKGYQAPSRMEEYWLVGFGININNETFPQELGKTAISLRQVVGRQVELDRFCLSYLAKLSWNIGLICYEEQQKLQAGGNSGGDSGHLILERWKQLSDTVGRRVLYGYDVVKQPQYRATVIGIQGDGSLLMRLDDGSEIVEHGGEIRYF